MNTREGVTPSRPTPQPRPSSPEKPKPRAMQDPLVLSDLHSIWARAMERAGLTVADLEAPDVEHVRAA
jgi:hypothetical protein